MVLATVSVKVDATHWDVFTKLYPQKGSKLIRDFITTLINNSEALDDKATPEKLTEMIEQHAIAANNERIKIEALKAQLEELKSSREQQAKEKAQKEADIRTDFALYKQDSSWYTDFTNRYKFGGHKDAGLSEEEFYKLEVSK